MINLIHGDCLEKMKGIPDGSIDFVLTDPPYGTTACKWDSVIPFELMWEQLKRVIKPNGAIALFGSEPFSSALRMSNIKMYKYDWIWVKERGVGFQIAKYRPMKKEGFVSIFSNMTPRWLPQKTKRSKPIKYNYPTKKSKSSPLSNYSKKTVISEFKNPESVLYYNTERGLHPTQKPVPLLEYLIKTYTLENEIALDFTMGSGSTGVACVNLNRNFIGIELDADYFKIAKRRIEEAEKMKKMEVF